MLQAKWIAFQIVVAMLTFIWIGTWADITQYGIAPAVISMFVAFVATGLLIRVLDRIALRRTAVSDEFDREVSGPLGSGRDTRNLSQHSSGVRVRENPRKIT